MNFLRRLAAAALGEAASLRPALPARYAALPAESEVSDAVAPQRRSHAVAGSSPAGSAESSAPRAAEPASPMAFAPRPPDDELPMSAARTLPSLRLADDRSAAKPSSRGDRSTARAVRIDRPPSTTDSATRAPPPPPASTAPVVVAPSPPRGALLAERLAPLAAAVVDAHRERASAAAAPTVVQVTIDRIDVRAPAATQPRPSKPSPARPTSSASLADYLRSRA